MLHFQCIQVHALQNKNFFDQINPVSGLFCCKINMFVLFYRSCSGLIYKQTCKTKSTENTILCSNCFQINCNCSFQNLHSLVLFVTFFSLPLVPASDIFRRIHPQNHGKSRLIKVSLSTKKTTLLCTRKLIKFSSAFCGASFEQSRLIIDWCVLFVQGAHNKRIYDDAEWFTRDNKSRVIVQWTKVY